MSSTDNSLEITSLFVQHVCMVMARQLDCGCRWYETYNQLQRNTVTDLYVQRRCIVNNEVSQHAMAG